MRTGDGGGRPTRFAIGVAGISLFMMGAGYALMRGVHIRADFIYRNWSVKTQATVDAILYLLGFSDRYQSSGGQ